MVRYRTFQLSAVLAAALGGADADGEKLHGRRSAGQLGEHVARELRAELLAEHSAEGAHEHLKRACSNTSK